MNAQAAVWDTRGAGVEGVDSGRRQRPLRCSSHGDDGHCDGCGGGDGDGYLDGTGRAAEELTTG